jgi:lysyl endopeptidase
MKNLYLFFIAFFICIESILVAQISKSFVPISFQKNVRNLTYVPAMTMPGIDTSIINKEDRLNNRKGRPFRFGKCFDVNYSLINSGIWDTLDNNDRIWRVRIKSSGAFSLSVVFYNLNIPEGAKIFLYNKDSISTSDVLTFENNNPSKILATVPVGGDELIVEYYEPYSVKEKGTLIIEKIIHDYIGLFKSRNSKDGQSGSSCPNEVDINCPEGNNWQNEKHAVARITFIDGGIGYACSGSLLNNVIQDGKAYFLTANHGIRTPDVASTVIAYFNYEKPGCNEGVGSLSNPINGAVLRATYVKSDFTLLELNSIPPISYNPYYLGWDNSDNTPPIPAVCIHHPNGDVKKISTTDQALLKDNGMRNIWTITHWAYTVSGHGVTEGGSSGSPLLDNNHRVIGQLWTGQDTCDYDGGDDYGRFATSWIHKNGTSASQLKNWLDPGNTLSSMPGLLYISDYTYSLNASLSGDNVKLNNVSVQNANLNVDVNNLLIITGTFNAPGGSTLYFH